MNTTRASFFLALSLGGIIAAATHSGAQTPSSNKRKLGPEVNTAEFREILPIVSADGRTLYFVREDQGEDAAAQMNAQAQAAPGRTAPPRGGAVPFP